MHEESSQPKTPILNGSVDSVFDRRLLRLCRNLCMQLVVCIYIPRPRRRLERATLQVHTEQGQPIDSCNDAHFGCFANCCADLLLATNIWFGLRCVVADSRHSELSGHGAVPAYHRRSSTVYFGDFKVEQAVGHNFSLFHVPVHAADRRARPLSRVVSPGECLVVDASCSASHIRFDVFVTSRILLVSLLPICTPNVTNQASVVALEVLCQGCKRIYANQRIGYVKWRSAGCCAESVTRRCAKSLDSHVHSIASHLNVSLHGAKSRLGQRAEFDYRHQI